MALATSSMMSSCNGADESPYDRAMRRLLKKYGVPGAALGIAQGGRITYAKGFGLADVEKGEKVKPDTLFRVASVTKPFTAAGVLRLVEKGKLSLSDKPFLMLGLDPLNGQPLGDSRLKDISVLNLLQHTGGWTQSSADPLFQSFAICRASGQRGPADALATIRYAMGMKLDFTPGSKFSYSNLGYCVLGVLMEKVTGKSLQDIMRTEVLKPCGIKHMELGRTLERASGETCYYDDRGFAPSIFPARRGVVPWPYGVFSLETNAANGGYIANVEDLLRFAMAMDESSGNPLLKPATMEALTASPGVPKESDGSASDYGLGWHVRMAGQGKVLWHFGSLPGTLSMLIRAGNGFDWALVFNKRPEDWEAAALDIQRTIHQAAHEAEI